MSKGFISNIFLIVLLNLLIKPFYIFGIDAQVQNQVASEEYGLYFSLLNFSFLFNIILDFGINNYNAKNIAQHPVTLLKYLGSLIGLRLVLTTVYLITTLFLALVLGYSGLGLKLLLFLGLNQVLAAFTLYFRTNFAGLHKFKVDAFLSVLDRLLLIILCGIVLYGNIVDIEINIVNFVYAQTICYFIAALTAFLLTLKLGRSKIKIKRTISFVLLKKSSPYALLVLLMMLYTRTDAIMLERLLIDGKQQAGIYAAGFRLLDAANIFPLLIAGILLPSFAKLIKQKEDISNLTTTSFALLFSVSTIVATLCFFHAESIISLIYTHDTSTSAAAFKWIILNFIPISTTYVFGTLLSANGSLKALNLMAISGFALNVILNLILIPIYKAEGAAFATIITQTFACTLQIILAYKIIGFKMLNKIGPKLVLLAGSIVFLNYTLSSKISFSMAILYTGMASLFLIYILRIVRVADIKSLLKEKF